METDPVFQQTYKSLFENVEEEEGGGGGGKNSFVANEYCELPMVDLRKLDEQEDGKKQMADAAKEWGFFLVVNHGISQDLMMRLQNEQLKLFSQPFRLKSSSSSSWSDCYQWGTPTATSLMQFSWSEAFHIPLINISRLNGSQNDRSPIEEFAEVVSKLAQKIAEILAENIMGTKTNFFAENCNSSSCYLRLNRYPPCPIPSKLYGLVPHTDSDFLTILKQDFVGGLQLVKDGKWISVKPNPDALIVNIGDLFQAWSNGIYRSIEHRVAANPRNERFSVAYFLCPSNDTVICSSNEPSIYKRFNFREYRQQVEEDVKSTGSKIGLPRFMK